MSLCVCVFVFVHECMHACIGVLPGRRSRDPSGQSGHHRLGMDGLLVQGTPSFPAAPSAAKARTAPLANQHQSGLFAGMTV